MAFTYQTVRHELWLYLPGRTRWINPAHIESVWLSKDRTKVTIHFADTEGSTLWIDDPDDVAAATAWLEARS